MTGAETEHQCIRKKVVEVTVMGKEQISFWTWSCEICDFNQRRTFSCHEIDVESPGNLRSIQTEMLMKKK